MKLTKRFQPEVLEKWHAFFDNFKMPSLDFYEMVKKELEARKVPGLKMALVKWKEGGVLSAERQYLRLMRERWVFDICAAPFGTGYLFSYRFTEIPIKINPLTVILMIGLAAAIPVEGFNAFRAYYGFTESLLGILTFLLLASISYGFCVTQGLLDPDTMLLQIPGIGPLYDRYFRQHTYYREDTRLMYLATVPAIVKMLTEKVTVAEGVKQPGGPEATPIFKELAA